jgi:hypothetical protein
MVIVVPGRRAAAEEELEAVTCGPEVVGIGADPERDTAEPWTKVLRHVESSTSTNMIRIGRLLRLDALRAGGLDVQGNNGMSTEYWQHY